MSEFPISQTRPVRARGSVVAGVIAFSCGVILLYRLSVLPPPEWFLAGFITAFCIAVAVGHAFVRPVAGLLAALMLGLGWSAWQAEGRLAEVLPGHLEGHKVTVSGYVCDIPSAGHFRSLRFSLCVTRWHPLADEPFGVVQLPGKLRLAWYGKRPPVLPAHRLRLEVVLKRPHGTLNDAGFRYEDWLFRKGFRATGTVRSAGFDPDVECGLHCQYRRSHLAVTRWVTTTFAEARQLPLVNSLLVGDRGLLTDSHWQVLKATGTVHLVAISGLHLSLVALAAGLIARRLLALAPVSWLGERRQRQLLFVAVAVACLVYALMAGFTVPTRRALLMVLVGGWALLMARQSSPWHAIAVAMAGVLMLDPFAPLDPGFWLSFGAVAVLILAFSGQLERPGWLRSLLVAQFAIFAGLWPVLQWFGQGQPLAGMVANLLAIPWVSLVVMPVLIAGALVTMLVPALSGPIATLFDWVLGALWQLLSGLAQGSLPGLAATPAEVALLAVLVLILVRVPAPGARLLGALALVAWLVSHLGSAEPARTNAFIEQPEIRIFDVGQGLSLLVRHHDQVLVYDLGPAVPGVFSAVESTLLPNFQALGVSRIQTLVISHGDSDHAGDLAALVRSVAVDRLVSGELPEVRSQLPEPAGFPLQACRESVEPLGELRISYWRSDRPETANDASCVLRIEHPPTRTEWILPGDITARVEAEYLAFLAEDPLPEAPQARVLLAPHHGSRTSSSARWVAALKPDVVVYSAGYRHRFGHPHPLVTGRYRAAKARAFSTACSGMLTLTVADEGLVVAEQRTASPFWIGSPGQGRERCRIP